MTMLNAPDATSLCASVTWTVKLNEPADVGVPKMVPVESQSNPAGNVPVIDQLYGVLPPEAESTA